MKPIISRCGLICSDCGAYIATITNDDAKRKQVASEWRQLYNAESIKPEDINCLSCLTTTDQVFSYCKICEIRSCAIFKDLINCAHCDEYPCEKLSKFFNRVPEAKENLENIRKTM